MPLNNSNNNNIKRLKKKEPKINIRNFFLQKELSQKNININLMPGINLSKKSKRPTIKVIFQNNLKSTNIAELSQNDKTSSQNSSISDFFLSRQDKTLQELLEEDKYLKQNNEFKVEENDNLKQNNEFAEDTSVMHYLNSFLKTGNSLEEFIDIDQVDYIYNQEIQFSNLYNEIKNIYTNLQLILEKYFNEKINQNNDLKNYSNQINYYIILKDFDNSRKIIKDFIEKFRKIYDTKILNETSEELIKLQTNFNEKLSDLCLIIKKFIDDNNNLINKQKILKHYENLIRVKNLQENKKFIILFILNNLNKLNQIIIKNLEKCYLEINLSYQKYKNELNQINSEILKELSEIPNPSEIKLKKDGLLDVDYYFNTEYKKNQITIFPLSDNEYKNKLNNLKKDSLDSSYFPEILISQQCTIDDLELITEIIKNHQCPEKK